MARFATSTCHLQEVEPDGAVDPGMGGERVGCGYYSARVDILMLVCFARLRLARPQQDLVEPI